LARYSGRTLEAYRQDLRSYFSWAKCSALDVLSATRPHIELYRHHMEQRGLAASTIDRRVSTVCGFYRFAHIDGRITSNPAQYVRRPRVHPTEGRGLDRCELGRFPFTAERVDRQHAALAVLLGLNGLRVSEACETNIEDLALDRGHRTLRIVGKGNKPAVIPLVPAGARTSIGTPPTSSSPSSLERDEAAHPGHLDQLRRAHCVNSTGLTASALASHHG
jgi:site-specific recombinase XerD